MTERDTGKLIVDEKSIPESAHPIDDAPVDPIAYIDYVNVVGKSLSASEREILNRAVAKQTHEVDNPYDR